MDKNWIRAYQALVDAGVDTGERKEKDVGMKSVATRVIKRRVGDRRTAIPRPTHHPEMRRVNVMATQDT